MTTNFDRFLTGYIAAALEIGIDERDEDGNSIEGHYFREDLAPVTLAQMEADCHKFWNKWGPLIEALPYATCAATTYNTDADLLPERVNADHAGSDFWLTRGGHGAGFWDGAWPEPLATGLTAVCKEFGEVDLYVGDDRKVYAM